jgi:hypothetical protein
MINLRAALDAAIAAYRANPSARNAQAKTLARITYLTYRQLNRS